MYSTVYSAVHSAVYSAVYAVQCNVKCHVQCSGLPTLRNHCTAGRHTGFVQCSAVQYDTDSYGFYHGHQLMYCTKHCTQLRCSALHCTELSCIVLYCTVLYFTALYCTFLKCTSRYGSLLHCIALHHKVWYITPHLGFILLCSLQLKRKTCSNRVCIVYCVLSSV